jgi:hypothetical protein
VRCAVGASNSLVLSSSGRCFTFGQVSVLMCCCYARLLALAHIMTKDFMMHSQLLFHMSF